MSGDDPLARLLPDYDLGRPLGRGAFGEVRQARHRQLGREVALKVISGPIAANPEYAARFRREARVLAQLDHAHVVRVFDYREGDGLHVLVMEVLDGGTLRERADRGISAPTAVAASLAAASALHHVHTEGVLHRDVKPENLMFDGRGTLKVTDFGLARGEGGGLTAVNLTTAGESLIGTPAYMAPEQIAGDAVGPAADQYSLAAVLYELLSGRLTHSAAEGPMRMLAARMEVPADPLGVVAPAVPPPLADAVGMALATDPSQRFASLEGFAVALAHAAGAAWGPRWTDLSDVALREGGPIRDAVDGRGGGVAMPLSAAPPPPAPPGAPLEGPSTGAASGWSPAGAPTPSGGPSAHPPAGAAPVSPPGRRRTPVRWMAGAAAAAAIVAVGAVVLLGGGDDDPAADGATTTEASPSTTVVPLTTDWEATLGEDVFSSPAVAGGVAYVGSDDGKLHALDTASGVERWTYPTGGPVRSSPTVVGDVVLVGSDDGKLHAVGLDGTGRWTHRVGYQIVSGPASDGTTAVVGADRLHAVDLATGEPRWDAATDGDVVSSPVIAGDLVVVGSNGGTVHGLALSDGAERWAFRTGGPVLSSPTVVDGVAYVGSDDGHLYGIDVAAGTAVLDVDLGAGGGEVYSSPVVVGDLVVVGVNLGVRGALVAVDRTTEEEVWRLPTAVVDSSPAVDATGELVAVGNGDGEILVVRVSDGALVGSVRTGGTVQSSPAFDGGRVVVGSADGRLRAISGWAGG